jgi:hypothetical protein
VYFSEELKYAVKLGYTITPHHGYRFNRSNKPFKEFVQTFYDKKRDAKDGAIRQLAKLTLNSTYGTFGSKIANETTSIVRNDEELEEIYNNYLVTHEAVIGDGFIAVTHGSNPSPEVCVDLEDYIGLVYRADRRVRDNNTSVSISAAVTAISRVIIHKYKTIPGNPCIYSDTDSVILQYPLSDDQIGTELGQMKLEYKIKEGYFVAPKIYYIETDQGEVIKKFKGVASAQVTKEDYLKLYQGSSVTVSGNLRFRKRNKVAGLNKLLCAKTIKPYDGGKRSIVRDSEGCWVDTKAVNLNVLEGTIDPTALVKSAAPDPKTSKLLAPLGKT